MCENYYEDQLYIVTETKRIENILYFLPNITNSICYCCHFSIDRDSERFEREVILVSRQPQLYYCFFHVLYFSRNLYIRPLPYDRYIQDTRC